MPIKFQYNKTYLQQLGRELRVRENALPTLQAKESALRIEVHRAKTALHALEQEILRQEEGRAHTYALWQEFPDTLVSIAEIRVRTSMIAGVKIPVLDRVVFTVAPYSLISAPAWIPHGVELLKDVAELSVRAGIARKKAELLEHARKKTTQKVNLYEKVQIPAYRATILKIKRFLEDGETLDKASQKILKAKLARTEMAA